MTDTQNRYYIINITTQNGYTEKIMRYLVTFCGRRSEIIKAHDDEEAIQIAQAMAFDAGIDVDVDCVQRLKPIKRYNTYNPDDAPRYEYV